MRAFDYIQRFNLDIKYKLDKQYVMSNILFKLVNDNINSLVNVDENEFDALFTISLIEINSNNALSTSINQISIDNEFVIF